MISQPPGAPSNNPLLRRVILLTIASSLLILGGSVFGIHWVYKSYVIKFAELDSINISRAIVSLQSNLFLHRKDSGPEYLEIDSSEYNEIDATLTKFLRPFDILKIKIFDLGGRIIYSTDKSLIGLIDSKNTRLKKALGGSNDSKLQTKGKFSDLLDEEPFDIDIVETYVPIYNDLGDIVGSFEIYKDGSIFRNEILIGVGLSFLILAGNLSIAIVISFMMIKKSASRLQRAQNELHKMATIDTLTGLYARSEIVNLIKYELILYRTNLTSPGAFDLCLVMIDIDHFKSINDNYGHPAGDTALSKIAHCIKSEVRSTNIVGRFGGEEFLVVLPGETMSSSQQIDERIRVSISELDIDIGDEVIHATASFGISQILSTENDYQPALSRADEALYEAKNTGRNKVVVYQDSTGE